MAFIDIFVIINVILMTVLAFIWVERRLLAGFQIRYGPNRVGPFGLLQPVADAIKVLTKEDIIPTNADRLVHYLAPVVAFVPLLMIFAVIPFQKGAILADLNVGILYIVAIGTISGIGVFMAGWSSNNKYSLLGAMREISQMVSYEVPIVLSIIGVVMVTGSLSMQRIVE
ncbi:MAG: NADH-quinone oxidoreductase subunit H, partial [Dehalococcoidia bacterium]|nr:NADH-quinone oxidoreductase subunit H [Dehalococcoidia bacterium]